MSVLATPSFFCDWLTCRIPLPHSTECLGGRILMMDANGEIQWTKQTWAQFQQENGSFSSKVGVRSLSYDDILDQYLCGIPVSEAKERAFKRYGFDLYPKGGEKFCMVEISGNPTKFLQGHNIWGNSDFRLLLPFFVLSVLKEARISLPKQVSERIKRLQFYVSRFDLTTNLDFKTADRKNAFLNALNRQTFGKFCGRNVENQTVMLGHSGRFQIMFYDKSAEIKRHFPKLPNQSDYMSGDDFGAEMAAVRYRQAIERYCLLTNYLTGVLPSILGYSRLEIKIGSKWLFDKEIKTLKKLLDHLQAVGYRRFVSKALDNIKFGVANMDERQVVEFRATLNGAVQAGHVPQSCLAAFELWTTGKRVRDHYARRTFYRLRKHIMSVLPCVDVSLPFTPAPTTKKAASVRDMIESAWTSPTVAMKKGVFHPGGDFALSVYGANRD